MTRILILFLWLVATLALKLNSKLSFCLAIFSLFGAALLELTRHPGMALNFITLSYGFVLVGTVFFLKENYYENKK